MLNEWNSWTLHNCVWTGRDEECAPKVYNLHSSPYASWKSTRNDLRRSRWILYAVGLLTKARRGTTMRAWVVEGIRCNWHRLRTSFIYKRNWCNGYRTAFIIKNNQNMWGATGNRKAGRPLLFQVLRSFNNNKSITLKYWEKLVNGVNR